jgi:uncharacterized protein
MSDVAPSACDDVRRALRAHAAELHGRFAVRSLALFGSVVRGAARPGSDVDLLVEFERPIGLFHLIRTGDYLSELLGGAEVDLVQRAALIPELREPILAEAVDVLG